MDRNFYDKISFLQKFKFENEIHGDISMKAVFSLPIHMHDGAELLYVLEGSIRVKISFNYYDLSQGDFLFINTFEVHSIEKISEHNILLLLSCNDSIFGSKEYFFAFDPYFYRNFYKSKVEKVKKDMVKFYIEREENPDNPDKALALLNEIGDICTGYFQIQNFDPIHKSESPLLENPAKLNRIGNTFQYFYSNHEDKIQLAQVAKRESIDKFYASHLIKSGTGSTFHEMLNTVRIDRAEVAVLGTDMPMSEISDTVGFSSYQYFVQEFKKFFGMTPSVYRKLHKQNTFPIAEMKFENNAFCEDDLKRQLIKKFNFKQQEEFVYEGLEKDVLLKILFEHCELFHEEPFSADEIESVIFKKIKQRD